ncbi:MAG: hypothetical protein R6X34_27460, partial [Chloroflexota bacterium]
FGAKNPIGAVISGVRDASEDASAGSAQVLSMTGLLITGLIFLICNNRQQGACSFSGDGR